MRSLLAIAAAILVWTSIGAADDVEVWTFDRLDRLGGHATTVLGDPRVVQTPVGAADRIRWRRRCAPGRRASTGRRRDVYVGSDLPPRRRPAGTALVPPAGVGSDNRLLFEIRVIDHDWYFDSYGHSGDAQQALMNRELLHPLGAWYHVAAVYDGREFRNYVDGKQEGAAEIHFAPQRPGRSAIGVRINLVDYFKGAIHVARFTRRALPPSEFLRTPAR
jgi:hypothetical protein